MKLTSKQKCFDSFADSCGPNWHRGGPYESTLEPYRASWVARHPKKDRMIYFDFFKKLNAAPAVCACFYFYTPFGCQSSSSQKNYRVHCIRSSTFRSSLSGLSVY